MDKQSQEKVKLLLVEDDKDFSAALSLRLTKRSFKVTIAPTAEDALGKLKSSNFDVVVADIKLPGMNGMELLTKVRQLHNNLPVIMLTGYGSLESAKEAVRLNAADYILKPLDTIDDLLNPINKAVLNYKLLLENKRLMNDLQIKIGELKESKSKLEEQKLSLEQKNSALTELIEHMERAKNKIKEDVAINVNEILLPILEKLKLKGITSRYIDLFRYYLKNLASSFGNEITRKSAELTPKEIEICSMLRGSLTSKEVSQLLNLSSQTIDKHRKNIRKKLGISGKKVNLTSYLQKI